MTDAGESEHPAGGAPHGHGGEPPRAGIDTSGRLIKAGVALVAVMFIGYGVLLLWIIATSYCGERGCGPFYLIPIIPIILGLLAVWAGRGALRGNVVGLAVVGLLGAAMVGYGLLVGVQVILWAVQNWRLDAAMLPAFVFGLVGFMLVAGVRGRLRERRRTTWPNSRTDGTA